MSVSKHQLDFIQDTLKLMKRKCKASVKPNQTSLRFLHPHQQNQSKMQFYSWFLFLKSLDGIIYSFFNVFFLLQIIHRPSPVFIGTISKQKLDPVKTCLQQSLTIVWGNKDTLFLSRDAAAESFKTAFFDFLWALWGSRTHNTDITLSHKVVMANMHASSCLFSQLPDTQQHYHSFGVMFLII